jgi:capsid portal protein
MYYIPFQKVRISALDGRQVPVDALIMRDGVPTVVRIKKYFRKFCSLHLTTSRRLRWFKEFGDPRTMDAMTGEYTDTPKMVASELIHYKQPFGSSVYGIPRWIGTAVEVLGRSSAQYVNYDLFNNQGIPPMAIMVSGGVLTDQSLDELETLIRGMRGTEQWNKILILESTLESIGVEEKGSAKIELKNLTEYRKEDQMFDKYLTSTGESIRHRWRLPPLYVGGAETFTHATARAAQTVAEEQVFIPEREGFDEEVNMKIVVPELKVTKWAYKTKGPRIVGADEITSGVTSFANAGALTVNHAIDLANRAFGTEMSKFNDKWADYPIALILALVESGRLKGLEDVDTGPPPPAAAAPRQGQIKALPRKMFDGELFSAEEQMLYKRLKTLQIAAETAMARGVEVEHATGDAD